MSASTFFLTPSAYAQGTSNGGGNFFSGLVSFISQKFGLEKSQVQTAVNEYKTQQKGKMVQNMEDREKKRLDTLVSQGKITSEQETAIINELKSLKTKYKIGVKDSNQTPEERASNVQSFQNDLKTWAASQNIDVSLIMPIGGMMGKGMGHKGFGLWKNKPTVTP